MFEDFPVPVWWDMAYFPGGYVFKSKTPSFFNTPRQGRRGVCAIPASGTSDTSIPWIRLWELVVTKNSPPTINRSYLPIILSKGNLKYPKISKISPWYTGIQVYFYSQFVNSMLLLWISNRYCRNCCILAVLAYHHCHEQVCDFAHDLGWSGAPSGYHQHVW